MNKIIQEIRNTNARKFDQADRIRVNVIRFDHISTWKHNKEVILFCMEHMEQGHDILTRARLHKTDLRKRLCADAVCLQCGIVCEIAFTEKEESLQRKREIWTREGFYFEAKRVVH